VGSSLLVSEFTSADVATDNVLALDGPLVAQLTAMQQGSLEAYARERAAERDAMFAFVNRPAAPPPQPAPDDNPVSLRRQLATLFTSSAMMRKNCPERNVDFYMKYHDTPGPRAVPMRRASLAQIATSHAWTVCEKTDGVRSLLFFPAGGSDKAWYVDRNWTFTPAIARLEGECALLLPSSAGPSLLDGEVVKGTLGSGFVCFDAVFVLGEDVGARPRLTERIALLKEKALAGASRVQHGAFTLVAKDFLPLAQVRALDSATWDYGPGIGVVECDGLVFSPQGTYYEMTVQKYKRLDALTVDFRVAVPSHVGLRDALPACLSVAGKSQPVATLVVHSDEARRALARFARREVTLECRFDAQAGVWHAVRTREDKAKSNHFATAWSVLESVAERLSLDDVAAACEAVPPAQAEVSEVAAHYDDRQRERNEGADADPRIAVLRRMNNVIKQFVIATPPQRALPFTPDDAGAMPEALAQQRANAPAGRHATAHARKGNNNAGEINILDVACGRGGDLGKYFNTFRVGAYVGVDVSSVALAEAEQRAAAMRAKHAPRSFSFVCCDAGDGALAARVGNVHFDLVSVQFALHYFCPSEAKAVAMLRDLHALAKPGATLLATMLDGDAVDAALRGGTAWRNDVCAVELVQAGDAGSWGRSVKFTLGDAVVGLEEPLVPNAGLESAAAQAGWRMQAAANFARLVSNELAQPQSEFFALAVAMKALAERGMSAAEWAACGLYRAVVMVKV